MRNFFVNIIGPYPMVVVLVVVDRCAMHYFTLLEGNERKSMTKRDSFSCITNFYLVSHERSVRLGLAGLAQTFSMSGTSTEYRG